MKIKKTAAQLKILVITDKLVLLGDSAGIDELDTVKNYQHYGGLVDKIDIIVFSSPGYGLNKISSNVFCHPTNSFNLLVRVNNCFKIAANIFTSGAYDLVIGDSFLAYLIACFLKKRYHIKFLLNFSEKILYESTWWNNKFFYHFLSFFYKFFANWADCVIADSSVAKKYLLSAGLDSGRINVISDPIDLSFFNAPDSETSNSIKNEFFGQKIVLLSGPIGNNKNLLFLLKSFKKIIKYHERVVLLLFSDNGRKINKINKIIYQLRLSKKVNLIGRVNPNMLVNYYHAADIVISSSTGGCAGDSVVFAAACAKPVVAFCDYHSSPLIVEGKTGFLRGGNKEKIFIKNILALLADENLAVCTGRNAYEFINQKYHYRDMIDAIISLWIKIVKNS